MDAVQIHEEFFTFLKDLTKEEWKVKVNKNWTVKDVVAHLVGWEREDAETIFKLWKTQKRAWFLETTNFDDFNKKWVGEYSDFSPQELIEEWEHWYKVLNWRIRKIGIDRLKSKPKLFGWLFNEGDNNHYYIHLKQIKKALNKI